MIEDLEWDNIHSQRETHEVAQGERVGREQGKLGEGIGRQWLYMAFDKVSSSQKKRLFQKDYIPDRMMRMSRNNIYSGPTS